MQIDCYQFLLLLALMLLWLNNMVIWLYCKPENVHAYPTHWYNHIVKQWPVEAKSKIFHNTAETTKENLIDLSWLKPLWFIPVHFNFYHVANWKMTVQSRNYWRTCDLLAFANLHLNCFFSHISTNQLDSGGFWLICTISVSWCFVCFLNLEVNSPYKTLIPICLVG
jgi:hypothetical protein